MRAIRITDFLGTPCLLAPEKGTALASEIRKQLQGQPSVNIDFAGYEFLSSAFLNHAFGQICIDMNLDPKLFHERVLISGMDEDDVDELELAIDNAQTRRTLLKQGQNPDQYYSSRLPA